MKSLGVKKGDRVTIYMPMIPEAAYAMLAYKDWCNSLSCFLEAFSPELVSWKNK
ncbi:MAG: hypothetical protein CM15mP16_12580 [Candidatus Pelagibacterales bacterium]|nr:MAG: hypothetical protein CM15mP16_12580 [Pelagibacterales bacterium]